MKTINITPDNKITKVIHKEGKGPIPKHGQIVVLNYEGRLKDNGFIFDSSKLNKKHFKFLLGKDDVIDGLTTAISSMHLGEQSTFIIGPDYGYGEAGRIPTIPPNATLEFDIELYDIREKFYNAIDADKRAKEVFQDGNNFFKEKKYDEAIKEYHRALHIVDDWLNKESKKMKIQISRNLADCYGIVKNWQKSLKKADYVLKHERDDSVALYRKAEALIELNQLNQAKSVIEKGLKVSQNSQQFVELNNKLGKYSIPENTHENCNNLKC